MKKRLFLGIVIGILSALIAFGSLYYFGIVSFNSEKEIINRNENKVTEVENEEMEVKDETDKTENNTLNSVSIDYDKLVSKLGKSDYSFIKMESIDYNASLSIDGNVIINFNENLDNIKDAKDIISFNDGDFNSKSLYIIDSKGKLYKYTSDDYNNKIYIAEELKEYNDIEKIFIYYTRKKNAGGCDNLVVSNKNNDYQIVSSYCH